ncbi:M20/M25/M40 family metallo-hydrolase [Carboxylicivirga caseinilyticus]|uniref:M20/M25/M40 family metallo-hydrolase n=1 Tax=Carboxylicivirga caseinilyticus TaxID=3417572 RepID=UPI003D34555D|nr:M20/M25/M40 family metallo-hydrolase [Marinilabiliaceae bacterium A049]
MNLKRSNLFLFCALIATPLFAQNQAERLKKHVYTLASDSLEGRGLGTEGKIKAINYIAEQFKEIGLTPLCDDYKHQFIFMENLVRVPATNVVGMLKGNDPELSSEYIVIGAHYDHLGYREKDGEKIIYNGADDNASGVATVIETARYLKQNQSKLKYSVIFVAFDAEESGLIGSRYFLSDKVIDPAKVKFMFSIDMVGMYSSIGSLRLQGMALLKDGDEMAQSIAVKNNLVIAKANTTKVELTDTKSFADYGIPATHLFTGLKSPYHKPEDTADKLDYEGMNTICTFLCELSEEIATQDMLIAHRKATQEIPPVTIGGKIGMGSSRLVYNDVQLQTIPRFAIEPGLFAQIKITRSLFLQPEVVYDIHSYKVNDSKINMQSITTPVSLMLKTYNNDMFTPKFFVLAGGYYSYHLNGKVDGEKMDFNATYNKDDYGLIWGFGFEFYKVQLSSTYRNSLQDFMQDSSAGDTNRSAVYFNMGWRF